MNLSPQTIGCYTLHLVLKKVDSFGNITDGFGHCASATSARKNDVRLVVGILDQIGSYQTRLLAFDTIGARWTRKSDDQQSLQWIEVT
jgi:hypothetical protein